MTSHRGQQKNRVKWLVAWCWCSDRREQLHSNPCVCHDRLVCVTVPDWLKERRRTWSTPRRCRSTRHSRRHWGRRRRRRPRAPWRGLLRGRGGGGMRLRGAPAGESYHKVPEPDQWHSSRLPIVLRLLHWDGLLPRGVHPTKIFTQIQCFNVQRSTAVGSYKYF